MERFFARIAPSRKVVSECVRLRRFARKAFPHGDYGVVCLDERGGFHAVVRGRNFGNRAEYVEMLRPLFGRGVFPRRIDRTRKYAVLDIFVCSEYESSADKIADIKGFSSFIISTLRVFEDFAEYCKPAQNGVNKQERAQKNPRALPRTGIFGFKVPITEPPCAYRPVRQTLRGMRMRARASAGCAPSERP